MRENSTTIANLPLIFDSIREALAGMEKQNIKVTLADVIDRIGSDMARVVRITQGDGGTMAELHEAAWSMAILCVLQFSLVHEDIVERAVSRLSAPPHSRTVH